MTEKRFKRYLLDGGFWFEEYVEPVWAITDRLDKNSPITHIEFKDEYKDLCDEVVKLLNELHEENENLIDVNVQCCNDYSAMRRDVLRYKEENKQLKSEYKVLHTQYQDLKKFVENNFDEYLTQEKLNRQIIKLSDENEQLKKDRFICLDCKHSGYAEIGCLCEKKDHWTDYKTECKDYEELE